MQEGILLGFRCHSANPCTMYYVLWGPIACLQQSAQVHQLTDLHGGVVLTSGLIWPVQTLFVRFSSQTWIYILNFHLSSLLLLGKSCHGNLRNSETSKFASSSLYFISRCCFSISKLLKLLISLWCFTAWGRGGKCSWNGGIKRWRLLFLPHLHIL